MKNKFQKATTNDVVLINKIEKPKRRYFKKVFKRDILSLKTEDAVEHTLYLWKICSQTPKSFREDPIVKNFFKEILQSLSQRTDYYRFIYTVFQNREVISGYIIGMINDVLLREDSIPRTGRKIKVITRKLKKLLERDL